MSDPVFFPPVRTLSLSEVAEITGGRIARGEPGLLLTAIAPLDVAGPGDLTFLDNPRDRKSVV